MDFVVAGGGGALVDVGGRERRLVRRQFLLVLLLVVSLIASLVSALAPTAASAAPQQGPKKPACPDSRPDRVSAIVTAQLCKKQVEVADAMSETTRVWALPDGSTKVEAYAGPVRFRDGSKWTDVDVTMVRRADGTVGSKAHPRGLSVANGGAAGGELVTLGRGSTRVGFGWTAGALPQPELSGAKATYRDVLTGVDLIVEATRTGYRQLLVVKDRQAADAVARVKIPVRATGLGFESSGSGSVEFTDAADTTVGGTGAAVMWDASADQASGEPKRQAPVRVDVTAPGENTSSPTTNESAQKSVGGEGSARAVPVDVPAAPGGGVREVDVTLQPDAGFLADPATVYPVTIDPVPTLYPTFDTFVQSGISSDQSGESELKLGTYDGGSTVARSFLRWDTSEMVGARVYSATVKLWEFHSYSCREAGWQAWLTGWADTSTRWSAQPTWYSQQGSSSETKGYSSSCGDGWVSADVTGFFQAAADLKWAESTMGLRAASESSSDGWKRFNSAEAGGNIPYVVVNYNTPPQVWGWSSVPPTNCATGDGRPAINTLTPTLQSYLHDPDGTDVVNQYEWYRSGGSKVGEASVIAPSGTVASVKIPPGSLVEGGAYGWRVRAMDSHNNAIVSEWTRFCEFMVDTTKPGAPLVSSSTYPSINTADTWGHGGVGQAGAFTLAAPPGSADVVAFTYQLDTDTTATTVTATGGTATATISPTQDGRRTLTVRAKDRAGNLSDPSLYLFNAGRAGLVLPRAGATVAARAKLQLSGDGAYNRVRYQYRRGPGGAEYDIPTAHVVGPDGTSVGTYPAPLGSYAVWNAVDTLGTTGGVVQVRAVVYSTVAMGGAPVAEKVVEPGYTTQWVSMVVDPNGDGASSSEIGPGSVNLLTGDYSIASTDADEFGLSVQRSSSSRETSFGWVRQGERLTANQRQITTDTTGFVAASGAQVARSTSRGQESSTDSLVIEPTASNPSGAAGEVYAAVGGDTGGLRLDMKPGRRYRMTGWIYVPSATGLEPTNPSGLRIVGLYKDASGTQQRVESVKAGWVDAWQELTVDLDLPVGASEAAFRLYNGHANGSGKQVFFDNLSVTEVIAPFGPQWRGGVAGGVADVDYTTLTFPSPELAVVTAVEGGWVSFARSSAGLFFPEPGAEQLTLTKISDTAFRLSETDGTVTEFSKQGEAFVATASWTPDAASTTRYVYDTTDRRSLVTRVINPVEAGVGDCTTPVPARGCEVFDYDYDYATATTATASGLGDFNDRIRAVKAWVWDPVAGMLAVEVARYAYDSTGRLREAYDPRLTKPLKTTYEYDSIGHVIKSTPAGQLPWMFDYTTVSGDGNTGRLAAVRRAALKPGSKDDTDGETATKVVYRVPLTKDSGGPYDLDAASVARWGQRDVPTDATAVFGPESDPDTNLATTSKPGNGGYNLATVTYLNASAQTVNTAVPGGHIDSQTFDQYGNIVWSLEAANRELALGLLPDADTKAAELGLPADSVQRADQLVTTNRYSPDGLDLLETLAPLVKVALEHDLADPSGALPTLPAGTQVLARGSTAHVYDEGKPDGATYHLETTERTGAMVPGYPAADVRVTQSGYSAEKGGVSGWQLKKATSTSTDAGTAYIVYDQAGRATKSWGIGSSGSDARTSQTTYYTAGANTDEAACGNHPEWAGQACISRAAGAVIGHDPARAANDLPVRRVESYTRFGDVAVVSETAAGKTRRTENKYDGADRIILSSITSDDGVAVPTTTTEYDSDTGLVARTKAADAAISREHDLLGRMITYTDADDGVTHSEFDRHGNPTKVTDPTGSTSYTYDRSIEPRGMLTSVTDSVAGTFTARYSPDGQLITVGYPGGLTRTDTLDASFAPVGRKYARADGQVVYAESIVENTAGQWVSHTYTGGKKTYGYDTLGRLTSVRQSAVTNACVTRLYSYDGRTNRTSRRSFRAGSDGTCRNDGVADSEDDHTYDTADRITDAGYVHDAFGRVTATPTGLSNTFYANDLVASQQLGDTRQQWTIDPAQRLRGFTTDKQTNGIWSNATSKLNHYGDDADKPRWIVEDSAPGSVTRNVAGPDNDLAATTSPTGDVRLQLTNLHGDVAATIDPDLTAPEFYAYDEFGAPADVGSDRRYGWLGGKQRSGETIGDVILMGVRLYDPALGRFLQMDPVPGGSANAYDYSFADPVNRNDLDGKFAFALPALGVALLAAAAAVAATIAVLAVAAAAEWCWKNCRDKWNNVKRRVKAAAKAVKRGVQKATRAVKSVVKNTSVRCNRYPNAGGGGCTVRYKGRRVFNVDYHRVRGKNRPHYHRRPGITRHRPWDPPPGGSGPWWRRW